MTAFDAELHDRVLQDQGAAPASPDGWTHLAGPGGCGQSGGRASLNWALVNCPVCRTAHPCAAEQLRGPVRAALLDRAATLRRSLPDRPVSAAGRFEWLRMLDPGQASRAALLDHLEALCEHLAGHPAPGYSPGDPMPGAALDAADGFTDEDTAVLIAVYRASRRAGT
ncbi:hypothetical protein ACFUC2_04925 [[Kitasatospora] papulosa]|uniref:hypothetical protein n=1 Tax=Streptomyces TaxID=1883 RepID=UPI0033298C3B